MDIEELLKSVKAGQRKPLYLLHGDEPYFIDQIADFIQDYMLSEADQVFNQRIFYGKDTDSKTVLDELRQYPMMASHRLVLLKEAQDMKTLLLLEPYFDKPIESSILVVCYKYSKFDQRTRAAKAISKNGLSFESKKIYENQVAAWISNEASKKNIRLQSEAAQLMAEYLGADLGAINQDLEKIKLSFRPDELVTMAHLEEVVGIHKEFNVFELQKVIGQRSLAKVFQIVNYMQSNPKANPSPMVFASLYSYFSKLYTAKAGQYINDQELMAALDLKSPFFLKEYQIAIRNYSLNQLENAVYLMREYDLKSKGVNNKTNYEDGLLKELVLKIMM